MPSPTKTPSVPALLYTHTNNIHPVAAHSSLPVYDQTLSFSPLHVCLSPHFPLYPTAPVKNRGGWGYEAEGGGGGGHDEEMMTDERGGGGDDERGTFSSLIIGGGLSLVWGLYSPFNKKLNEVKAESL